MGGRRYISKAEGSLSSDKADLNGVETEKAGGRRVKVKAIENEDFVLDDSDMEEANEVLPEVVDLVVAQRPQRNHNTLGDDSVFIGDPIDINKAKKI